MRAPLVGLTTIAVLAARTGSPAGAGAGPPRRPCPSGPVSTVGPVKVRTRSVVVYDDEIRMVACYRATRRRTDLGEAPYPQGGAGSPGHEVGRIRVRGAFVLIESGDSGYDTATSSFGVYDVLHGRLLHADGASYFPLPYEGRPVVSEFVGGAQLGRAGAVAYLWSRSDPARVEVRVQDAAGPRVVYGGTTIDRWSLRLVGDTVRWSVAGLSQQARVRIG